MNDPTVARGIRLGRGVLWGAVLLLAGVLIGSVISGVYKTAGSAGEVAGGGIGSVVSPDPSTPHSGYSGADDSQKFASSSPRFLTEGAADSAVVPPSGDAAVAGQKPMVVRTKSMRVEVTKVRDTVERIRALATSFGGSVSDLQISNADSGPVYRTDAQGTSPAGYDGSPLAGYVTVRVPVAKFDAFATAAAKLGKVLRQAENDSDVTQQYVDMNARLGNLKAEEARLRQFFKSAKTVPQMLQVERELSRVRGEIESLQAQVDYLKRQADLSTITLELVEPKPIVRPSGTDWGFGEALTTSVRAFVGTINALIIVLGGALPIILLVAVVLLIARAIMRRRARRAAPQGPSEDEAFDEAG